MENQIEEKKIEIGKESLAYLNTTRKWTMFFAILGFVLIGIMLLGALKADKLLMSFSKFFATESVEGFGEAEPMSYVASILLFLLVLFFAIIYFIPVFFLYRFSRHTARAVKKLDHNELGKAFKNMKSFWFYLGVFVIITLVIYILIFIIAGASLAFLSAPEVF
ncbi:MAG TPA: hypothetical protein PLN06_10445 [Bacteroidales bacterium]|nr:hypothetical protein [Bacteroidales bacterium]HQG37407.1 hypothetical protein [Bacteroidales bacterium]HQG52745.1 hypothetical protein [Bacteroidales bacterium]HQJ20450.1 hypothetical protein [Bacteroidales bacterium]HRC89462.1 hypothetical protein [Bacteroidales bacterium]